MAQITVEKNRLDYFVFSGGSRDFMDFKLYDAVLAFWKAEWSKVFSEIDAPFLINEKDFESQSRITAITYGDEVVGIQTLNDFVYEDIFCNPYFRPYTIEFIQGLVAQNVKRFQAMQYFLVSEDWSARATRINFAAIILGLSFKQQKFFSFDATVTLARKDVAAASTAKKFNMNQLGLDIQMHNVPVGQLLCTAPCLHPHEETNALINTLWNRKKILTRLHSGRSYEQINETI
jgi:hypothetical protein